MTQKKSAGGSGGGLVAEATVAGTHAPCAQTAATAAYLDGELDAKTDALFEEHLKTCAACSGALSEQRRLLCLLDAAFDETFERKLALPKDFTRIVRARAQTDMSGLRSGPERATALKICAALSAVAFVLLGATFSEAVIVPLSAIGRGASSIVGVAGHAVSNAGAGGVVLVRAVGDHFLAESNLSMTLMWVLIAGAALLLLIGNYHRRAGIND